MIRRILTAVLALTFVLTNSPSFAAADKPLVIESGQIKQLPSATTLQIQAPTSGAASINLPHGTAPSSPNNGDCWTTTAVFACQLNGVTASFSGANTGDETSTTILSKLSGASGGGTSNFLRADGSWAVPPGTGGGGGGGHKYEVFGALPLSASFSSDHVSNLTFADGTYSLYAIWTASASNTLQVRYQSAPSTPYSLYSRFRAATLNTNDQFGIVVRSSSTGKIVTFGLNRGGFISTQNWTNSTTFGSTAIANIQPDNFPSWFRIKNDGTNLTFYYSWDGEQWTSNGSVTLASFIGTADQIGFYVVPYNAGSAWISSFGTGTPS